MAVKMGDKATCDQCGREIEYIGHWRHVGATPRHIAKPKKGFCPKHGAKEGDQVAPGVVCNGKSENCAR